MRSNARPCRESASHRNSAVYTFANSRSHPGAGSGFATQMFMATRLRRTHCSTASRGHVSATTLLASS